MRASHSLHLELSTALFFFLLLCLLGDWHPEQVLGWLDATACSCPDMRLVTARWTVLCSRSFEFKFQLHPLNSPVARYWTLTLSDASGLSVCPGSKPSSCACLSVHSILHPQPSRCPEFSMGG